MLLYCSYPNKIQIFFFKISLQKFDTAVNFHKVAPISQAQPLGGSAKTERVQSLGVKWKLKICLQNCVLFFCNVSQTIDEKELESVLQKQGHIYTNNEIKEIMNHIDLDNTGTVDMMEYLTVSVFEITKFLLWVLRYFVPSTSKTLKWLLCTFIFVVFFYSTKRAYY